MTRRVVTLAAIAGFAVAAAPAAAQEPILGFTGASAEQQRAYEDAFTRGVSAESIGRNSRQLSRRTHLVGTAGDRRDQGLSVQKLRSYGLDVATPSYSVYATRPMDVDVTMTAPTTHRLAASEPVFPWQQHPEEVVAAYNAYSPSGDVSGDVVYANYGLPDDYKVLEQLGISVKDKIVLVRYGRSFRGVKAQQAEKRGAKGLLIYSDPEDDGFVKGAVYPDGPWRPSFGIQRGSIQYIFQYPGDPLTPGTPSIPGRRRIAPENATSLPHIPTTPISYGDARPLLEALGGPEAPDAFKGGLPITYHVGPGPTQVHLKLDIAFEQTRSAT